MTKVDVLGFIFKTYLPKLYLLLLSYMFGDGIENYFSARLAVIS